MTFLPTKERIADKDGYITPNWLRLIQDLLRGTRTFTLATQPTLQPKDAGAVGYVSDYGHLVTWSGTAWTFAPGDGGAGYLQHFAIAPDPALWALCDGSVTTYLTVGGPTLTATSVTTPDLAGTLAVLRSGAYTGSTVAGLLAGVTSSYLAAPVYLRR